MNELNDDEFLMAALEVRLGLLKDSIETLADILKENAEVQKRLILRIKTLEDKVNKLKPTDSNISDSNMDGWLYGGAD